MNEPGELPDGLRHLLDAAAKDVAPAAAKAKARLALGLPPVAPVVTPPTQPPTAPPVSGGAASGSASVAASQGAALKLLAVVALAGGTFVAGLKVGDTRARQELAALAPPAAAPSTAPSDSPPAPSQPSEVPLPVAPAAPPSPVQPSAVTPPPTAAPTPVAPPPPAPARPKPTTPPEEDLLALELELVEQARVALAQQQPAKALSTLATYEQRVPKGALRDEAQLLKLEALVKAGRRPEAEALGEALSRHTGSELVRDRIKGLLRAP